MLEEAFARIDDLKRIGAADHAVRRLRVATEALEAEFAGITQIERKGAAYVVDAERARAALKQYQGTTLQTLVATAEEG